MAHSVQDVRNLVLFGHGGTGKTAFVDALALKTGISSRRGDSADGTSISNTEPEEKERKQTLTSHVFGFGVGGTRCSVIDTPGHADFVADAISAMHVVENGLLFVSALSGPTFHGRRLWAEAGKASLARSIVLTHLDGDNVDFDESLAAITEVFGDAVAPMNYPDTSGPDISAVHSVLKGEGPRAAELRERIEERVAEADDEILEIYLEKGEISQEDLDSHFGAAVALGKLVPLFVLVPNKDVGLESLCDLIEHELPSPAGFGGRAAGVPGSGSYDQVIDPVVDGPFAAKVYKVVVDPYVGRLSYLRCFRGQMKAEEGFLNVRTGKHDRVGGLLACSGAEQEAVPSIQAGDLFAVGKLEDLCFGDTVTADGDPIEFPPVEYPPPSSSYAVTPKSRGDEQKINEGLDKLVAEDPTFSMERHPITAELIVSGQSPLHIELQLARLSRRYGINTEHHLPQIPYRETITAKADGHHRHKKQSGGKGQFGEVYLRVAPRAPGAGFEFVDSIVGGTIPRQFIPEVEKGVRRFLESGGQAGCPVVDVQVEIYDGKFHDVDSDQISFQLAGERAFAEAFAKAKPILLEPVMDVTIHVPERFTGDVAGNLSSIRGRMAGMEMKDGIQEIKAQVPHKEMLGYATQLRSITAGEGSFVMTPADYEQLPSNLQAEVVAAYRREQEAK